MKTATLTAALVCLTAFSAPAFALDIGVGGSVGASVSASSGEEGGASLGLGANAEVNAGANLGLGSDDSTEVGLIANASGDASLKVDDDLARVIALIDASVWTDTSLSGLTDIDAVAYDVTGWINADNQAAFDLALTSNAAEIADLQAALSANAALEGWLEANNASAEDVIAIGVAADGSLAVFTN